MAGNVRFESSSASPEDLASSGNYPNGQRGFYSLDRSGSFREGSESRMFSSVSSMSRGMATSTGDVPSLSQWLTLDPITMGDQKYIRLGDLISKVLGTSIGTTAEDNAFGAAHAKPPPAVATEELKQFKANVLYGSIKARGRAKKIDESLHNLDKYVKALNPKKLPRNEMLTNERPGGTNMLKMGALMQRNSPDFLPQRLEDRTKSVGLNKRVRTSVAETRAERSNIPARQALPMIKDRNMLKDGGETSDVVEEKIHRLPAGEGWEKKMKRKRSVGTVLTRPAEGDGELKRVMHHKLSNESGPLSCDAQGFRPGSSGGANGINKLDNTSLLASSNVRAIPKSDSGKVSLSRDFMAGSNKECIKGNKLNIREDNHLVTTSPLTKGKASRLPRTGPVMAAKSSPNIPRPSGSDGWEQSPIINKINSVVGASNRKRPLSVGSSSPPITQWGGQRPQKTSRSRRANLVSPVSNLDESQTSLEGCIPSDLGARIPTIGSNGLLVARGMSNGTTQYKVKQEIVLSPARLSESEESGAGENCEGRSKEKGVGSSELEERTTYVHSGGPSLLLTKKNKAQNKEEMGDGVRRQGRSGQGPSYSKASISPLQEKLENSSLSKPVKSSRPGFDKNGSKSGRPPLKKMSERKVFTRLCHTSMAGSPDLSGDSDDDREDLLAAANFACNSSYLACSGSFWKKMELMFASISLEDAAYLKLQGDLVHEDFLSQILVSGEKDRGLLGQIKSKELTRFPDLGDQVQDNGFFCGTMDSESMNEDTPLYQRVLSALIVEDEIEEFPENRGGRNMSFLYHQDDSSGGTCLLIDAETRKMERMEVEYYSMLDVQVQKQSSVDRLTCNGTTTFNRGKNIQNRLCNDDFANGGTGLLHSDIGILNEFSEIGCNGPKALNTTAFGIDSFDCQYDEMPLKDKVLLEVQSIGLHLEAVPDLADGEEETINQGIVKLQKRLRQQMSKKKEHIDNILKAKEKVKETEERGLEQVAIDRLVELAYKKKLATRGSSASKSGVTKVSKQVASAFMKRVLARCHKFDETGKSCFAEPSLRDIIFAAPRNGQTETVNSQPVPLVSGSFHGDKVDGGSVDSFETHVHPMDQDFVKTGPIFNRWRKREVLLDDVGGSASLRATSALGNTLSGGTKGKRSERERDKDTSVRNSVAKSGRASMSNFKGERKMKSKPKQKTAQLSTAGNGFGDKSIEPGHFVYSVSKEGINGGGNKKRELGLISHDNVTQNSSEVKDPFDLMEELGGVNDLNDHQDLSTLLNNLSADDLQDQDLVGLQVPMDDLSELALF